ncbi:hypothetical protein L1987_01743 [Smallanthus sonchifolius]|uniref:Uncharacterized protein n=1 Tax=Smallanthus sonchifolius TaxID=185202 RepID=A0ACB9K5W5_9ASTR|nr:hypothetical protein L1987_01743 [Smallanthus sonchifolius]
MTLWEEEEQEAQAIQKNIEQEEAQHENAEIEVEHHKAAQHVEEPPDPLNFEKKKTSHGTGITIGSSTQPSSPPKTQPSPPRKSAEQPETPVSQIRLKKLSLEVHTLKNQMAKKDKEIDSLKTEVGQLKNQFVTQQEALSNVMNIMDQMAKDSALNFEMPTFAGFHDASTQGELNVSVHDYDIPNPDQQAADSPMKEAQAQGEIVEEIDVESSERAGSRVDKGKAKIVESNIEVIELDESDVKCFCSSLL